MSGQTYWSKMRGAGRSPLKVAPKAAVISAAGGFIAIAILAWLTGLTGQPWIMAPFGASCVLAFGVWESPLSQPRNIIGGHFISTLTGLVLFHLFGQGAAVIAAGVALAILFMMLTKTAHPPAGADPIVVILAGSGWSFLFIPVLAGAVVIVLVALFMNNAIRQRSYPTFWL
ncbi:HPP family protein [Paenibacillus gorillae]|uniref:HPP family protein n=1 Tax=Paenibacillus gorillae TaxID=1243662 RepID=UPI0004B9EA9F|nr:HPP family protein [Paenibacillus gorillae]